MIGKIFVTSSGYDPEKGKHVKDPYLGPNPSLGACRPDIREQLQKGDHIFVVSGKVRNVEQVVLGGFEVAEKISAIEAYERFPEQRLSLLPDGQITGNVIVNAEGKQHELDYHEQFARRIQNYLVGVNPIALLTAEEVEEGRGRTLEILREVFEKQGNSVREIIGRCSNLTEKQILKLRAAGCSEEHGASTPAEGVAWADKCGSRSELRSLEMVARRTDGRTPQRQATRQQSLFGPDLPSTLQVAGPDVPCDVVAIEQRRDGGTRYWCRAHRADATAKGGTPATKCRAADTVPIRPDEILTLDLNKYLGGVALWGAVPAVYDTTWLPMDRGIHVHARPTPDSEKEMDFTYRAVRLVGKGLPDEGAVVSEIDAIYFMVSSVFGFPMCYVTCTHCGWPHLDKDWFSVHPHRRHLCAGCGKHFHDQVTGIGNPIVGVRDACGFGEHKVAPAAKTRDIKQSEYPGGIQIWGSNPAFLWTSSKHEEEGIHVHAFLEGQTEPVLDDTFREVTIDGIQLDPVMVRVLMAQNVMPSLKDRVRSMDCPNCGHPGFDAGEAAYVPAPMHTCSECGRQFPTPGRTRNAVANPLPAILADLAKLAQRPPQQHRLDLLPETL